MLNLNDPTLLQTNAYINGQWIESDNKFAVINPATGDIIANVSDMDTSQLNMAIDKAYIAQKDWAAYTGKERSVILRKWYDLIIANANDLGAIITAEMGKPLAEAI